MRRPSRRRRLQQIPRRRDATGRWPACTFPQSVDLRTVIHPPTAPQIVRPMTAGPMTAQYPRVHQGPQTPTVCRSPSLRRAPSDQPGRQCPDYAHGSQNASPYLLSYVHVLFLQRAINQGEVQSTKRSHRTKQPGTTTTTTTAGNNTWSGPTENDPGQPTVRPH